MLFWIYCFYKPYLSIYAAATRLFYALHKAEFRPGKRSLADVNELLCDGGREVIWPAANCGGAHVLPATLNVKSEPGVTGRRDKGSDGGPDGGGCIESGARVMWMPA